MLEKLHKVKDRKEYFACTHQTYFLKAIYVLEINELEQNNNNPLAALEDPEGYYSEISFFFFLLKELVEKGKRNTLGKHYVEPFKDKSTLVLFSSAASQSAISQFGSLLTVQCRKYWGQLIADVTGCGNVESDFS